MNKFAAFIALIAVVVFIATLIFAFFSGFMGKSNNRSSCENSGNQTVVETIKKYFDENEYKYRQYIDQDSITSFRLGFQGKNESIELSIDIIPESSMYQIICIPDTQLPKEAITNGIIAMNEHNMNAAVVSGCIGKEGNIVFWLGRIITENSVSEQDFAADFSLILRVTDKETSQIYNKAINNETE